MIDYAVRMRKYACTIMMEVNWEEVSRVVGACAGAAPPLS